VKGIYLLGAAITATAVLSLGVAESLAAGKGGKATRTTCKLSLTTQIPSGSTTATPGTESGSQFGGARCHGQLGGGVQADTFSLMSSGNLQGRYRQYFDLGSIAGSYTLSPVAGSPPSQTTFSTQGYAGKARITAGTGTYQGARGTATLSCSSLDGVHFTCTEKIRLTHM
jgi:hypothetical protein